MADPIPTAGPGMASIDTGHPIVFAEPTKTRPGDQQLPNGGRECVQDALIALIEERKQLGIQRYGSPLMTHNGRDSVRDATEEALDLTVYLMQVAMEMRDLQTELAEARATIERVRALPGRSSMGRYNDYVSLTDVRTALDGGQ